MKAHIIFLILGIVLFLSAFAQENDNCTHAILLEVGDQCITQDYSNANATAEADSVASDPACGSYAVIVTENSCTDTSACYSITVVGVSDEDHLKLILFPKPVSEILYVELPHPYDSLHSEVAINDTIVNYTQRRLDWINDWLIENYHVDPERIHINGHSMGAAGTTALMKTYPDRYASVTIFNNGLGGHSNADQGFTLFGDTTWNNPTNLYRRDGSNVRIKQVFNLNDRNVAERDLPLVRMFHGKQDDNGVMMWDAYVVSEYKKADSLGWGMQLYWSERGHGIETGDHPVYPDHWTHGEEDITQTVRDNVAYEEAKYRNTSFPAFYNHRLEPQAPYPGDGSTGIIGNGGTGSDWGSWGGYHDWNTNTLIDAQDQWQVTAWLIDSAVYAHDNSPFDSLVSSLVIRRPQNFTPPSGTTVYWSEIDSATNIVIKEGETMVGPDDLISVDSLVLYKYPVKTYITFTLAPVINYGALFPDSRDIFSIFPNPSSDQLHILVDSPASKNKWVTLHDFTGTTKMKIHADEIITKVNIAHLKPDTYFVKYHNKTLRFVKY